MHWILPDPTRICDLLYRAFGFYATICAEGSITNDMPEIGTERAIEPPVTEVKPPVQVIKKREIDRKAEEIKAKNTLPPPPGNNVDFDTMIQWLGLLTEDMWKQTIVRLYRHEPIINNELVVADAPKYIDVIGGIFDKDYIIEHHGGGKYGFFVNGGDGSKKLFEARLTIPVTQYDPKFDIRTLDVNAKDNIKWVQWAKMKGLLDKDNRPVDTKKVETPTAPVDSTANAVLATMDRMFGMFQKMNNQEKEYVRSKIQDNENGGLGSTIGTILVEKMKQDDPNRSMESFAKMASMFKTDNNSELFKLMLQMNDSANARMDAANARMMEVLKEIRKPTKDEDEEKEDPLDKIDKYLTIFEKMGVKVGGRSGPSSYIETGLELVKTLGVPAMNLVNNIMHMSALAKQQSLGNVQAPPMPNPNSNTPLPPQINIAPPTPTNNYTQMGVNPNPEPIPIDNVKPLTPEIVNSMSQPIQEIQIAIHQAGGLISKHIMDGKKGWEFGSVLVDMYGAGTHAMVAKYGAETLVEGMKSVPEFWKPLESTFGEEYLENWVGEFINYEEILARMDDGDDFDGDEEEDDEPQKNVPIGQEIRNTPKPKVIGEKK